LILLPRDSNIRQRLHPLAYFPMDNADAVLIDKSNHGSTLTKAGTPSRVSGPFGGGILFGGTPNRYTDNYIIPRSLGFVPFSMSFWFNTTTAANTAMLGYYNPLNLFLEKTGANRIRMYIKDTAAVARSLYITIPYTINDGKWHHVVFCRGIPSTMMLYVNGVLMYQESNSIGDIYANTYLQLGAGNGGWFPGALADFAVYPRVITPREVAWLSRNPAMGASTKPPYSLVALPRTGRVSIAAPELPPRKLAPYAYWSMDAPDGVYVDDDTRHGHNLGRTFYGNTVIPGRFGRAVNLDGAVYLRTATGFQDVLGNKSISFTGWYRIGAYDLVNRAIIGWGAGTGGDNGSIFLEAQLPQANKRLRLYIRNNLNAGLNGSVYCTRNTQDNKWHHFAVVRDYGNKLYLYVDGISDSPITDTFGDIGVVGPTFFMVGSNNFSNKWIGGLDDIAVWDRALTPREVQWLSHNPTMNAGMKRASVLSFAPPLTVLSAQLKQGHSAYA